MSEEQRVNLFVDGSYAYGRSKVAEQKALSSHAYSFAAGPVIFLNSAVALELSIGYAVSKTMDDINSKRNLLQAGIGLQFHLEREEQ